MRHPVYHDFWVKTCGSLLVSHLIESLGREEWWFVLLQRESTGGCADTNRDPLSGYGADWRSRKVA